MKIDILQNEPILTFQYGGGIPRRQMHLLVTSQALVNIVYQFF